MFLWLLLAMIGFSSVVGDAAVFGPAGQTSGPGAGRGPEQFICEAGLEADLPKFQPWIFTRGAREVVADPRVKGKLRIFENDFARFGLRSPLRILPLGILPQLKEPIDSGKLLRALKQEYPQWAQETRLDLAAHEILRRRALRVEDVLEIAWVLKALSDPRQDYFLFLSPLRFSWHGRNFHFSVSHRAGKHFQTLDALIATHFFLLRNIDSGEEFSFSDALPERLSTHVEGQTFDVDREVGSVRVSLSSLLDFFGF